MRRRRAAPLALLLLLLLLAPARPAAAGDAPGLAVEGADDARLAAAGALAPYANAGYRLEIVRPGAGDGTDPGAPHATVHVDLSPLASTAPFAPPPAAPDPGPVVRTARAATAGAATTYDAVSAVLGWMVHHTVRLDGAGTAAGEGEASNTPATVLAAGGGSARALARLAVALVGAVGVEARTVDGWVLGVPRVGAPHGRHTWIEVRLPDRGWVYSDPLYHHHYVPATYVPAATGATTGAGAATPPRLEERRDRSRTVDLYPAGAPGVTARRNADVQVAGALRVVVTDGPGPTRGSAVLDGPDGRASKVLVDGESVFVGLAGGSYRLEVYLEGRPPLVRRVAVAPRQRSAVFLPATRAPAAPAGAAGGADD